MMKVSSTNLSHRHGGGGRVYGLNLKLFHEEVCDEGADRGIHGCTINLFIILTLEEEVCVFETNSKRLTIWGMDMLVFGDNRGSCHNLC